jgi:hypothetical protein
MAFPLNERYIFPAASTDSREKRLGTIPPSETEGGRVRNVETTPAGEILRTDPDEVLVDET